jgi:hypothetical protein
MATDLEGRAERERTSGASHRLKLMKQVITQPSAKDLSATGLEQRVCRYGDAQERFQQREYSCTANFPYSVGEQHAKHLQVSLPFLERFVLMNGCHEGDAPDYGPCGTVPTETTVYSVECARARS